MHSGTDRGIPYDYRCHDTWATQKKTVIQTVLVAKVGHFKYWLVCFWSAVKIIGQIFIDVHEVTELLQSKLMKIKILF